jgi:hypothetical protein
MPLDISKLDVGILDCGMVPCFSWGANSPTDLEGGLWDNSIISTSVVLEPVKAENWHMQAAVTH